MPAYNFRREVEGEKQLHSTRTSFVEAFVDTRRASLAEDLAFIKLDVSEIESSYCDLQPINTICKLLRVEEW
jgi:hypothetical protein